MSVEEEAFTLHVLDGLEFLNVDKRLLKIVDCWANNTEDEKQIIKRLRNYAKDINKKYNGAATPVSHIYKTNEMYEKLIDELYSILTTLKLDEEFSGILKYYLSTRNLPNSINFMSTFNRFRELNRELEDKVAQIKHPVSQE
jgi:hypothetical protein